MDFSKRFFAIFSFCVRCLLWKYGKEIYQAMMTIFAI